MADLILRIGRRLVLIAALTLIGGLLSASLVRFAPGYGTDERELDARLSAESKQALRNQTQARRGILSYYGAYLAGMLHGDFGNSTFLQRPVNELLKERFLVTLRSVLLAMLVAWALAMAIALFSLRLQVWILDASATVFSGLLIALPSAVVAIFLIYLRAPVFLGIVVVIFPKVFRYLRNILGHTRAQPFMLAAQARGIGEWRIIFRHVIPFAAPTLVALLGLSLSVAFGAAIPMEALSDAPGIGQLAWQAALNRDLPLLTSITLLITLLTVGVNCLMDSAKERTT